jgi:hypothetical protein
MIARNTITYSVSLFIVSYCLAFFSIAMEQNKDTQLYFEEFCEQVQPAASEDSDSEHFDKLFNELCETYISPVDAKEPSETSPTIIPG